MNIGPLAMLGFERNYLTEAHAHYEKVAHEIDTRSPGFYFGCFDYMTRAEWGATAALTRPSSLAIVTGLT